MKYRIQAAAARSGVSELTIRAWERRYGIPRPQRTASGYRLYGDAEIGLLKQLREFTENGIVISDAVQMVQHPFHTPADLATWHTQILEAAVALDQRLVESVLIQAHRSLSPLEVFEQLSVPVLRHAGELWDQGKLTVAQEHLVTHTVRGHLIASLHTAPAPQGHHYLCAGFPDDQHDLGLLGAALQLRHRGLRVTYLGAAVPVDNLLQTVKQLRPDGVALSAVKDAGLRGFTRVLAAIMQGVPPSIPVVVGGKAADRHRKRCEELGALSHLPLTSSVSK